MFLAETQSKFRNCEKACFLYWPRSFLSSTLMVVDWIWYACWACLGILYRKKAAWITWREDEKQDWRVDWCDICNNAGVEYRNAVVKRDMSPTAMPSNLPINFSALMYVAELCRWSKRMRCSETHGEKLVCFTEGLGFLRDALRSHELG